MNRGLVAFLVAFALMFAIVGISYALAGDATFQVVPYDPGFGG